MKTPYPHFPLRNTQVLDGIWDFAFLGETENPEKVDIETCLLPEKIAVPGCFDTSPSYAGRRGTAIYQTRFQASPGIPGKLVFHGLGMWSAIYIDGVLLQQTALPYSQIHIDVPASDEAVRTLTVVSDNRFDTTRVPLQEQFFDFYAYGGIFRSVEWQEVPALQIERAEVTTQSVMDGTVQAVIRLGGKIPDTADVTVSIDDEAEVTLPSQCVADGKITLELKIPCPRPWSPENPQLHYLKLRIVDDEIIERFGLRTVSTDTNNVLINGAPVKLLGYCRHEAHPQYGPALPLQQLVSDLQILKDLGCNFIRGSHYPQDPRFLDLCDEMGLVVFEESMGWGQKPSHFENPMFCEKQLEQTRNMVAKSFNHPCVCMWGFLNEGASNTPESRALYSDLAACIRELDPSRPVTYATNHPFDDLNLDLVDIVSVNCYPGWYASDRDKLAPVDEIIPRLNEIQESLASRNLGDKPLIISEIGAGAIYGWRDPLKAHWSEEYQAAYLETVCLEIVHNDDLAGVALWQFCDCRTYGTSMALGRPRGFNNKGTLDEYRRPKLAYQTVRDIFCGEE